MAVVNFDDKMDNLDLICLIGKGGFGEVFLVQDKTSNANMAMKTINKENLESDEMLSQVKKEIDILQMLSTTRYSSFFTYYFGAFETFGHLHLMMEYCDGGTLDFHLKREIFFTENDTRTILSELIVAVDFLHKLKIIHRDIKPSNIFLDMFGNIILGDFGLSKRLNDEWTNEIYGTLEYMAPELLMGVNDDNIEYTQAVDWWSLAITGHELATTRMPFIGKGKRLFRNIMNSQMKMAPFLSENMTHLLQSLLKKDPTQRLGYKGALEIKNHPFFSITNWRSVETRKNKPAITPSYKEQYGLDNVPSKYKFQPAFRHFGDVEEGTEILHELQMI
jgi:protein-serine/threonine kinase